MNYFLGIDSASDVLVADFEEGAGGTTPGLNHPVYGVTTIQNNTWYHAAATYDGSKWRLFLNGSLEARAGRQPATASRQHPACGDRQRVDLDGRRRGILQRRSSTRSASGTSRARRSRSPPACPARSPPIPNLLGRWGLNETTGTIVNDSTGRGNTGTIVGRSWALGDQGAPFDIVPNTAPGRAGPHQSRRRRLDAVTRHAERVGVGQRRATR